MTAAGWAGIDSIEIWNGASDKSGSALQGMTGNQTLFVYLHTPGKGTWY
jgi:hypothetical protein